MKASPAHFCILLLLFCTIASAQFSELSEEEKKQLFTQKTEERIRDLEINIQTICDKKIGKEIRRETVNSTVKYFVDEEKVIQVSSVNDEKVDTFTVRMYLLRLLTLHYSRVEIEWFETRWVSKFRQSPDGQYFGTVRVFQVFKGYGAEGNLKYKDITSKDIEVAIKVTEMDIGRSSKEVLHVRLGDIRVVETRAE